MSHTYRLTITDGTSTEDSFYDEHPDFDEIKRSCESWVRGGEWGDEGAIVNTYWTVLEDDVAIENGHHSVMVDPNLTALIEKAVDEEPDNFCGYDDEDHDWKFSSINSSGGTILTSTSVCEKCGLMKRCTSYGVQRQPNQVDDYSYYLPEHCHE